MIQCPECRQLLPDDSAFCDQCGKELKWCPECRRPKRGTECPVCGSDLVPGSRWLAGAASASQGPEPAPQKDSPASSVPVEAAASDTVLVGNGWRLQLKAGPFGRTGGMWPELSTCPYVSGSHGRIEKDSKGWLLIDAGSKNGTYVNGRRIVKEYIKAGDKVRIATLDFIVE